MPKKTSSRATKRASASTDTPRRTRASREETTTQMLDAAEELFAARNPRDVTVRDVAEKAGVSHALVHQYVGSKDDLLNAVLQRAATNRTGVVHASTTYRDAMHVLARQVVTNRLHSKALMRSAMDGVEYVSLRDRIETGQALSALANTTIAAGEEPAQPPHDIDNRVASAALTAMMFGWASMEDWLWPVFDLDPSDRDEIYRQLQEIAAYVADLILVQDETAAE